MSRSKQEVLQEALTAHGYLFVEPAIIRRTLVADIPTIMEQIHRALGA